MKAVLGIDVGATGIKGNIINITDEIKISDKYKLKTPQISTPQNVASVMKEIIAHFDWTKKPIGIGFPAVVSNGITKSASNIDNQWINFDAKKYLTESLQCDLSIINDADAAGIAEMNFGKGKDEKGTVIMITIGSGIGSALFRNGQLLPNTELGHLKWGKKVAEKYVSNWARESKKLSWEKWATELDLYLAHLEYLFSPELIILGGGISKEFKKYKQYFKKTNCKVVSAKLKNNAGIVGSAVNYFLQANEFSPKT